MRSDTWLGTCTIPSHGRALFQLGAFTLHSGEESSFKIECDSLIDDDLAAIAELLSERVPPFGSVEGIPRGGLRLAELMTCYVTDGPVLIVDDVWTSGLAMLNHVKYREDVLGAVIFARTPPPQWITPLFVMTDTPA